MCKNIKIYTFKKIFLLCSTLIVFSSLIGCSIQKDLSEKNTNIETEVTENTTDNNAQINDTQGNIAFYKQRLDEFNRKYDTEFVLPVTDTVAIEWITSLSPEAFDDFLMALYDGSAYDIEQPRVRNNDVLMGADYGEIENTDPPENVENKS